MGWRPGGSCPAPETPAGKLLTMVSTQGWHPCRPSGSASGAALFHWALSPVPPVQAHYLLGRAWDREVGGLVPWACTRPPCVAPKPCPLHPLPHQPLPHLLQPPGSGSGLPKATPWAVSWRLGSSARSWLPTLGPASLPRPTAQGTGSSCILPVALQHMAHPGPGEPEAALSPQRQVSVVLATVCAHPSSRRPETLQRSSPPPTFPSSSPPGS